MCTREETYIEPFRGEESTKLGVIRLKNLAYPDRSKMKIMIGDIEFKPIGFDTYGHPIISHQNYQYCDALRAIAERNAKFIPITVTYEKKPFCTAKKVYDSVEGIEKSLSSLAEFKKILIYRKQAAFIGEKLDTFVVFDRYILADNGHIYECEKLEIISDIENECQPKVYGSKQITNLICGREVHIPSEKDVCALCGKTFSIEDIENFLVSENEDFEKVHAECFVNYKQAIEYERASKIIDAVYTGKPKAKCEIGQIFDSENKEMKTCYIYKTKQGTIAIYFRNKVSVIEWHDNFKPFNMSIFENERVTKFDRGIHAWSDDDAIRYLAMAKKA